MRKFSSLLIVLMLLCGAALAADEYKIDPVHSYVGFSVTHMMVSTVRGRFTDFSGVIAFDPKDISKSSVKVTIKTASINTEVQQRDNHLRSADFFDVANHPEITFESQSVEKKGNDYVAHGVLTIRGVSKNVDMPFQLRGPVNAGPKSLLAANATLTINRQDFGVSWSKEFDKGQVVVGNDVTIQINVESGLAAQPPAGK